MKRIAIIGGGPAGLTAAIEGAKLGLEVELFDQYKIGDHIRCAEGFFDTLDLLGEPKDGLRFKVDALDFKVKTTYSFPTGEDIKLWMIDRQEWQIGLAKEARELGVQIHENSPISKDKFKELSANYDYIIDSSGAPSVTSKAHGWQSFYKETSGLTAQYTMLGDFTKYKDKIFAAILDRHKGYYWVFPKGDREANVGLIIFDDTTDNLWNVLEEIIEREKLTSYERTRKLGGICPVIMPENLVHGNSLLTGDAAGLVSALHGGGIDNACISGKIAAECIANNEVDQYDSKVRKVLANKLNGEKHFANVAYGMNQTILEGIFKMLHRSDKSIGEYGFLTGQAENFLKLKAIRSVIPVLLKK